MTFYLQILFSLQLSVNIFQLISDINSQLQEKQNMVHKIFVMFLNIIPTLAELPGNNGKGLNDVFEKNY